MLKRKSILLHSETKSEDIVESPFEKQMKLTQNDVPGRNYFEFINNIQIDKEISHHSSLSKEKINSYKAEFEENREKLINFLQISQKIKDKNFFTSKELKKKFKVNFDKISSIEEALPLFDKIVERLVLNKTQKRNWYEEDIALLFCILKRYCSLSNHAPDSIKDEDWRIISDMIPVKTLEQCKFKYLSLKKIDLVKHPWTNQEDEILKNLMSEYTTNFKIKWNDVAKKLNLKSATTIFRSGKMCRERWNNYLNPFLKKSEWTIDEDLIVFKNVLESGKKWSEISKKLIGRNENAVKNRYFSLLRKEQKKLNSIESKNFDINSTDKNNQGSCSEEIDLILSIISLRNEKYENESSPLHKEIKRLKSESLLRRMAKKKAATIVTNPEQRFPSIEQRKKSVESTFKKRSHIKNNTYNLRIPTENNKDEINENHLEIELKKEKSQAKSIEKDESLKSIIKQEMENPEKMIEEKKEEEIEPLNRSSTRNFNKRLTSPPRFSLDHYNNQIFAPNLCSANPNSFNPFMCYDPNAYANNYYIRNYIPPQQYNPFLYNLNNNELMHQNPYYQSNIIPNENNIDPYRRISVPINSLVNIENLENKTNNDLLNKHQLPNETIYEQSSKEILVKSSTDSNIENIREDKNFIKLRLRNPKDFKLTQDSSDLYFSVVNVKKNEIFILDPFFPTTPSSWGSYSHKSFASALINLQSASAQSGPIPSNSVGSFNSMNSMMNPGLGLEKIQNSSNENFNNQNKKDSPDKKDDKI